MADRTLVASATNLLARGFLVVPTDRKSRAGEPVNALFAVARAIHRAVSFKTPARAVAVIESDPPPASWPPILAQQLGPLPALLEALGVHVVRATDERRVVASYARAALAAGDDVLVAGMDKRFAQLVGEHLWWYDANKDVRYTPEIVEKRFGVTPDRVAEWLGLVGDDDTLSGVAGIGAKGATTILQEHGSVEKALAAVDALPGRIGKALTAAAADIPRELARARLDDRPLPVPLADLAYRAPRAAALNEILDRLGFAELLAPDSEPVEAAAVAATPAALTAALARMGTAPIAVHVLLDDDPVAVAGVALAAEKERVHVPFGGSAWPALATWLADAQAPKLVHDTVTTTAELHRAGVRLAGIAGDSMAASHLTQPSNWAPHELPLIAKHVLGRALPEDEAVLGLGRRRKRWSEVPAESAADFAAQRAETSAAVWAKLSPDVAPALMREYLDLSETLVRMEETGIIVDTAELASAEEAFAVIEAELSKEIETLAGHAFNINSSPQLGKVLFQELGLPIVSHTKTGWSTSIEALTRIENAHPIVPLVMRWRQLRRLRDNWIVSLRRCIGADGRVHSRFHPARSFSGDLVNTNPDLSRVPGRTPEMQRIRRAFVPPKGHVLLSVDFHQLGLYVLAHLTKDPALTEPLRRGDDMHALTAAAVLARPLESITLEQRQVGKVVNFATFAGQGASALSLQLGLSPAEAREMIARFDRRYAKVRAFQDEQLRLAQTQGYIVTISGRRWPIGGLESLDSHDKSYAERLARRATHEGSVADVSRRALLHADHALRAAGLRAVPVHHIIDEALFDVPEAELAEAARIASHAMRNAFALEVPLVVGLEAGPNWADLVPVAMRGV